MRARSGFLYAVFCPVCCLAVWGVNGMASRPTPDGRLLGPLSRVGEGAVVHPFPAWTSARSFMGWEDLDVVDPEAEAAKKGEKEAGGMLEQASRG